MTSPSGTLAAASPLASGQRAPEAPQCAGRGRFLGSRVPGRSWRKGGAPAQQAHWVEAGRGGQPPGACLDRRQVVCLPAELVDRVERRVAEAGGGVDRDQPAFGAAVQQVAGGQVPVEQDARGGVLGEPGREPAPALIELRRNQRRQLRVTVVELGRGVEQVGDALGDRRVGGLGNTAGVEETTSAVPGSMASSSSAPSCSSSANTAGVCTVGQPWSAAASSARRARSGLAFSTAPRPSAIRQRKTTDMLPRGIGGPSSNCHRWARAFSTPGSSSNHGAIWLPKRAVRRCRALASRLGTVEPMRRR